MKTKQEIVNRLSQLWKSLLKNEELVFSEDSHFFKQGGTSILALEMIKTLQNEFTLKMSLITLAKQPTLGSLAAYIEKNQASVSEGYI